MKLQVAVLALAAAGLIGAQDGVRAASAGVYTKAQAEAGRVRFGAKCVSCHGEDLLGRHGAATLAGNEFVAVWSALTAFDLFDRIRKTMPEGEEGSLSRQDGSELVAFLLSFNGYPAGQMPLDTRDEILKTILIGARK
jgi:mono/diheme cytochrome c family protein